MTWDWDFVREILPDLLSAFALTILITTLASVLMLMVGLLIALGRRSPRKLVSRPVAWFSEFVRRTPLLVQLYFVYFALPGIGVTLSALVAGILTLGIHHATYAAETYRAGIDAVPKGQWDAAKALGFSRKWLWSRVVLPQAMPGTLAAQGNWVILMFKQSALLSAITVEELLFVAQEIGTQQFDYLEPFALVAIMYFAVSYPASIVVRALERRFAL